MGVKLQRRLPARQYAEPVAGAISHDRYIPGIRRIADAVHAHGAKFAVQLHFGGLIANAAALQPVWCPSIPLPKGPDTLGAAYLPEEPSPPGSINFRLMTFTK